MIYLRLFFEFFKTGLFSIGGGMATLPFLKAIGESTGWFTYADLMNMLAVSESTPGPIGINMATYVGYTSAGFSGALVATIGEVTPCVIIIMLVAAVLNKFKENKFVQNGFYGLRPASSALIGAALYGVFFEVFFHSSFSNPFNLKGLLLAVFLWFATNKMKTVKGLHPIVFIAFSALCGIVFRFS